MNHPNQEEWVPYLFGEAKPEVKRRLNEHLDLCEECRAEIERWKRSLGRLDRWRPVRPFGPRARFGLLLGWAAAAAVVLLALGFAAGRLTSPGIDPVRLQAAIEPKIRQELRREFATWVHQELAKTTPTTLTVSGEKMRTSPEEYVRQLEQKLAVERAERISDCLALKRDVDTIALNADTGLRRAEQQLVELVNYRQPDASPTPPTDHVIHN